MSIYVLQGVTAQLKQLADQIRGRGIASFCPCGDAQLTRV